jgi:hypothetical protein
MALPTDVNVDLLLCDAIRQNADGKLDLSGYFPVFEVKLDPSVPQPVAINLCFVYVLKDGEGEFKANFQIIDPLGRELHRHDLPEVQKRPGQAHVMPIAINTIPIANSGNFAIVLELNGQPYRRSVRIFQ